MKDLSSDFEQVAIAYQAFCRAVDRASFHVSEDLRNRPELTVFEKQIRAMVPQTLPVFLNNLSQLERAIDRATGNQ